MTVTIDDMTERPDTSSYGALNKIGREKADDLIVRMRATGNPTLLGFAVRDMVEAGVYGPEGVGFCQRIADQILTT